MAELKDIIKVRLEEIAGGVISRSLELNGWEMRAARHLGPERYEYFDDRWRTLNIGDIWGRQGQTVFMRRKIIVPPEWKGQRPKRFWPFCFSTTYSDTISAMSHLSVSSSKNSAEKANFLPPPLIGYRRPYIKGRSWQAYNRQYSGNYTKNAADLSFSIVFDPFETDEAPAFRDEQVLKKADRI